MNDNKDLYTKNYMLKFADARNLVIEHSVPTETETVTLANAINRVLAKPLCASVNIPPFDNSAMDGFAVNAGDLSSASQETPVTLELIGLTAAGDGYDSSDDSQGKAWKIMTGAAVPAGFDSIIPVENTRQENNRVICHSPVVTGDHIRKCGEDFIAEETISHPGDIINANTVMAYAALGINQIEVFKPIKVAVFSTGKELVDDPSTPLAAGQIRNSNKPFILEWLKTLPVTAIDAGTNFDEVEKFARDLQNQLDNSVDIIISSGAVSMGDFDFIPQTIKKLGGEIIFHKAKIRPGKPVLFAKFPNGTLYFGLPGNPISAAIGLRFFVAASIRKILGLSGEKPVVAIATNHYHKKVGFRSILKANATVDGRGQLSVNLLDGQESFKIKPLLKASGWALIDEEIDTLKAGELIKYYPTLMHWE